MARNQKHRKGFLICSFGIDAKLLDAMDAAVQEQANRTRFAPLNRSTWIVRAIERDLAHRARSRRKAELGQPAEEQAADVGACQAFFPLPGVPDICHNCGKREHWHAGVWSNTVLS